MHPVLLYRMLSERDVQEGDLPASSILSMDHGCAIDSDSSVQH